jgi:uncharacterized hydrophobic protein (TIGR00271 family)
VIHVRAVSPHELTSAVVESLARNSGVLNLIVLEGVARNPNGDAVQFDVITAQANRVLDELRSLAVDQRGSITIENVNAELSGRAARAERLQPRALNLAPIWAEAEARIRAGGVYPPSWFALLTIAGLIGVVGILTNSQILIVGAMVVGPEYAAIISVALAVNGADRDTVRQGLVALLVGFSVAIVVSLLFSLVIRAFDLQPRAFSLGIRPVSNLINTPNAFSVVVAVLAGIVGVVSLTEARTSTLLGVFISVTTIPAAADIGLSSAYGSWSEARGSLIQLLLNVGLLLAVGIVGLRLQRRLWQRIATRQRTNTDQPGS